MKMLSFLKKLEDPDRPLLGPNIKALKFWGIILPESTTKRYIYILIHISLYTFVLTEWVDIFFIGSDINMILHNLKVTLLSSISAVKVITFLIWKKKWMSIIEYITKADLAQRKIEDKNSLIILNANTKYCRLITYLYSLLMYTTIGILFVIPIVKTFGNDGNGTGTYFEVVRSWVPFNKNTIPGYIAASSWQIFSAIFGGCGWTTSCDTISIVIMVFFKTELQLLMLDSEKIFGTETSPVSSEETIKRLTDCYRRHNDLVKYTKMFDSCISPIMLLYASVCSVMFCTTAYQITIEKGAMERLLTFEYLIFGVAQLFLYCWHSNDVYYASRDLSLGPYRCTWWKTNIQNQQYAHILTGKFNKLIVFTVGPFGELTIPTFISILKGACSYYTLLSKTQNK